ncbi:EamA family transporter RarD [uncultured Dysosmobacter sp.]|uniref:EamA family transporter RarD n=1 Tax=uncultured Dysosmobacter sp. TaxID=2591384 RepID=UPI002609C158|nr:EamA family transporter RarD [uncultured Dysosmobacter sp.]
MAKRGPLLVLACYIMWGLLPAFWRLLGDVDSFCVLAYRIVWSVGFSAMVLALRGGFSGVRAVLRDRGELGRLALAGVFICINWGVYIWAVNSGHMLDASLAYYMNPILSILLGTVFFRERLTRLQWLAVGIALTGLVITVVRYRQFPWMALIIGGSFAVYGAVKKTVKADALTASLTETAVLALPALLVLLWKEGAGAGAAGALHGWQWLLLPAAGVVTTVPLLLFSTGIKRTPMTLNGILMYVNPTLQLLLSVLYGEAFTATHAILFGFVWTGLALYLASGFLRSKSQREKERPPCA